MSDEIDDIEFNPTGDSAPKNADISSGTTSPSDEELIVDTPASQLGDDLEEMSAEDSHETNELGVEKTAEDLEAVFDVPVRVSVVLGRAKMPVSNLLKMDIGTVVELDRQVGEAIDIYINDRLIARGEIVLIEEKLGVTMTEIIKAS